MTNRSSAEFSVAVFEDEQQHENFWLKSKKFIKKAGAVGMVSTALLAGSNALASADEIVGAGGMGDPGGRAYEAMLRYTGQIGPNDTYHPVDYPASILGPLSLQQSLDVGLPAYHAALDEAYRNAAPGERVRSFGYSEGGILVAEGARQRYGDSVTPGTVNIDGAPVSDVGMFNPQDRLAQTMLPPITNMLGVPTHIRAPKGTILSHSSQDVWAFGGPSDVPRLISQAMDTFMGPAHAVQNPNAPFLLWIGEDGIVHREFPGLGTGGIPPNAFTMGGPAVPPPDVPPPVPVRNEDHPRWFPNSPNFKAEAREVHAHVNVPNPAPAPRSSAAAPVHNSAPAYTPARETDHSRVVVKKTKSGGTNKQTTSYSKKFEPAKRGARK